MKIVEDPYPYWDPNAKTSWVFVVVGILFGLAAAIEAIVLLISD